jgi:hypothetical protein
METSIYGPDEYFPGDQCAMPIFNQTHSEQTLVEEAFEKMAEQYLEH